MAVACGGNVTSGCPSKTKECLVAGEKRCVSTDDPRYGCASETTCLSCGPNGFVNLKSPACDNVRGVCAAPSCRDNYKHCPADSPLVGGCETNIATDITACGDCGRACPSAVPNGMPACVLGQCTASCKPGFSDCDQRIDNGCECAAPSHCEGTSCVP